MCIQNERGFTLIESLLHCLLFSVVAFGIALLLLVCMKVPTTAKVFEEVEFEVVSYDINHLLLDNIKEVRFDTRSPHKVTTILDKLSAEDLANNKAGVVELIVSEPYLYRAKGFGFEPVLGTVHRDTRWHTHPDGVTLYLRTTDGYIRERKFYVPTLVQ